MNEADVLRQGCIKNIGLSRGVGSERNVDKPELLNSSWGSFGNMYFVESTYPLASQANLKLIFNSLLLVIIDIDYIKDNVIMDKIIAIREYLDKDVNSLVEAVNDKAILNNTVITGPYGSNEAQSWIAYNQALYNDRGSSEKNFAITSNDTLIGSIGYSKAGAKTAEIGFWLAKDFRRQKIMQQILPLFLSEHVKSQGIVLVTAHVFVRNSSSRDFLIAQGFSRTDQKVEPFIKHGIAIDQIVYEKKV